MTKIILFGSVNGKNTIRPNLLRNIGIDTDSFRTNAILIRMIEKHISEYEEGFWKSPAYDIHETKKADEEDNMKHNPDIPDAKPHPYDEGNYIPYISRDSYVWIKEIPDKYKNWSIEKNPNEPETVYNYK